MIPAPTSRPQSPRSHPSGLSATLRAALQITRIGASSAGVFGRGLNNLYKSRTLLALPLLILSSLVFSSYAVAAPAYRYDQALTEKLSSEVAFAQPWTLSFDSAGNLFLADPRGSSAERSIVDEFDSSGALLQQLGEGPPPILSGTFDRGVAVNDETGHVYAAASEPSEVIAMGAGGEHLSSWDGKGTPAGKFGFFTYDAVDNSSSASKGEVYVYTGTVTAGEVDVFKPKGEDKEEGEYVRQLEAPGGFGFRGSLTAAGIAVVDRPGPEAGEVYVADPGNKVVDRFSAAGVFEASLKGPSGGEAFEEPVSVAIDEATGEVLVVDREAKAIDQFSASGQFLGKITQAAAGEAFVEPVAVAIQRAGAGEGDIYLSDAEKERVDVFAPESPSAPLIGAEGVLDVSADSASFDGELNPHGLQSSYHFEYGACASVETCPLSPYTASVPVPDGSLGGEGSFGLQSVGPFHVQGLSAGTTYHFRLVASNADGQTLGEERVFTTQGGGGEVALLDNRAWELVSPADKHGASLLGISETGVLQAAAGGGALSYLANAPTEEAAQGNSGYVQVLSQRGAGGWSSRDIATAHQRAAGVVGGARGEYHFFAADLSSAIAQPSGLFNPALSSQASEQTPYLRALGDCESDCYRPLVSAKAGVGDVAAGTQFGEELLCEEDNGVLPVAQPVCGPLFLGASEDLKHVVLVAAAELAPGAGREQLYEWSEGQLQLVSVLPPNGAGEELPAAVGTARLGLHIGLGEAEGGSTSRAVSADGSLVFWESQSEGGRLLVRDSALGKSAQLDLAEAACVEQAEGCKSGGGRFESASSDGSRVFFTDTRKLTKGAGATSEAPPKPDLYECRIIVSDGRPSCELTDLTPAVEGESADVQGDVIGAGEDGSAVYFVADGKLGVAGARSGTCVNGTGQPAGAECDLYVSRNGTTSLVARLSGGDGHDWAEPAEQAARVSPDGRWLAFMSSEPLTGYDNRDAVSGEPDAEVYLYGAAASSLVCASCDPTGARPVGVEYRQLVAADNELLASSGHVWEGGGWVAAVVPRKTAFKFGASAYQGRYLSNSGRLFFNSLDALVPQDVNGNWDVYEHEPVGLGPAGAGGCEPATSSFSAKSGGCTGLISSGSSAEESAFIDASETGGDVFFITAAQLTNQDVDHGDDIYDAHECRPSSPCIPPPALASPPCSTEASCKASPTPQPAIFGVPPSATFNGLGNLMPEAVKPAVKKKAVKCPRGKTRNKHGKCVKSRAKRKTNRKGRR